MSRTENVRDLPKYEYEKDTIKAGCLVCSEQYSIDFSRIEEHKLPDANVGRILQADPLMRIAGSARLSNVKCPCGGDLTIAVSGTDGSENINLNPN